MHYRLLISPFEQFQWKEQIHIYRRMRIITNLLSPTIINRGAGGELGVSPIIGYVLSICIAWNCFITLCPKLFLSEVSAEGLFMNRVSLIILFGTIPCLTEK